MDYTSRSPIETSIVHLLRQRLSEPTLEIPERGFGPLALLLQGSTPLLLCIKLDIGWAPASYIKQTIIVYIYTTQSHYVQSTSLR